MSGVHVSKPRVWVHPHLFYAGLRLGEQPVLRVEDVDLTDRLLLVLRGLAP